MPINEGKKHWDKGVPYLELDERVRNLIRKARDSPDNPNSSSRMAYGFVYALQLRNASRISEAVAAMKRLIERNYKYSKEKDLYTIEVLCAKKREKIEYRVMKLPKYLNRTLRRYRKIRAFADIVAAMTITNAKGQCIRLLKVNSHSLRYARITYLSEKGMPAQLIAKITHHSNLNFIVAYTQQKEADRLDDEIE
jgi:hypothetical protein